MKRFMIAVYFHQGHYSVGCDNEACLIYVTFSGRIYIYHNIKLDHVQTVSLIEALEGSDKVEEFMASMGKVGKSISHPDWVLRVQNLYICVARPASIMLP